MSKDRKHIDPLKELSPEMMDAYLKGKLSPRERHAVERFLLDHPFEAEAMQGLEAHEFDLGSSLRGLRDRLPKEDKEETKVLPLWKRPLGIAATIALLFVSSITMWLVVDQLLPSDEVVIKEAPLEEEEQEQKELSQPEPVQDEVTVEESEKQEVTDESKEEMSNAPENIERQKAAESIRMEKARMESEQKIAPQPVVEELALAPKPVARQREVSDERVITEEEEAQIVQELQGVVSGVKVEEESAFAADEDVVVEGMELETVEVVSYGVQKKQSVTGSVAVVERSAYAGPRLVKGKVVDASGEGIPGATVIVKGSTTGTITDIDGNFEIGLENEDDLLVASFIGYNKKEIKPDSFAPVTIEMSEDVASLEEVVVVGYGTSTTPKPDNEAYPDGGFIAFRRYVKENLEYPKEAHFLQLEGKVVVKFKVSDTGSLSDFEIKKGLGHGCDEEAIRLIQEGPSWNPSREEGQLVEDEVTLRIRFKLED
ncbi:TonB family protein [Reichenbachiella ulvae]|uniref:TonB family protein n=1 Tax=Reichenbachiella ulvae TaxID=2980104 RepID=A0ABT3CWW4_9BACT|nr:TonB family protein [Reichenbachiella ulvae]MCV9388197.1 TonB family protein [Reichenbachiella ulvae]